MSSCDDDLPGAGMHAVGNGFSDVMVTVGDSLNLKIAVFLFLSGFFIFSDTGESLLSQMSGTLVDDMGTANTRGTVVQLLVLCVLFLIFDFLARSHIV